MTAITLPSRSGPAPDVIGPAPHAQTSQTPPVLVQEGLWERMRTLPFVYVAQTLVSVSHSRALFLPEGVGHGPEGAFQKGREFAHLHPHHDGSLHVMLREELKDQIEVAGWGVRHPAQESILLYGPRDFDELELVWSLVRMSHSYAMGA